MFNRKTIHELKDRVKWLEEQRTSLRNDLWKTQGDLELVLDHLKVKIEERRVCRVLVMK